MSSLPMSCRQVLVQVMSGMREILPRLQKYLNTWDRYKHIWDVDKDAFMRRYAKANRALTAFETDITRYKELQVCGLPSH